MKTEYRILILGGSIMQLPAIRIAKRMAWTVIVADRDKTVPGAALADCFALVDLKDKEAMLAWAGEYKRTSGLDGIFTAGTDFSTTVAYVAEKLGLPGIPYSAALCATDKALMRAAFKRAGVPSPGFVRLAADADPHTALNTLQFPLVIKPVDNMGARGVRRIDNREELLPAFNAAIKASRTGSAILEEFMDGPEFSLDAIVYKGVAAICGVADRHIFFPPCFVEMGHTMPTASDPEIVEKLVAVFKQGIKALGITDGAAKGDVFWTGNTAKIGEIAARLSGGYMSGWTYPYASGIEPTLAALKIAVGLPPGEMIPLYHRHSAERAFISIPGCIKTVAGTEAVLAMEGVRDLFCRVKPGDTVVFPANNVEKCGNVITSGASRSRAITLAEQAVRTIKMRLKPGTMATEDFLFGTPGSNSFPVKAFTLENPANYTALQDMPLYQGDPGTATGLAFIPLPCPDAEHCRDWQGNTIPETLEIVLHFMDNTLAENTASSAIKIVKIGKIFWQAVLKGGYQGGIYCMDTLAGLLNNREQFRIKVETWGKLL